MTLRKSNAFLLCTALAAGVTLAARPGNAAPAAPAAAHQPSLRDTAIAQRAQWLGRGHSVQQLATLSAPVITGGSVTASTITVGAAGEFPSLSVAYATDTPGLNFIAVEFASPNGQTSYGGGYATPYYTQSGMVSFAIVTPLSLYASPGKWTLVSATVIDNAGDMTTYGADQLRALFSSLSFTVINSGPADKAAPKIKAGQLLNDTVSLGAKFPVLKATITASNKGGPGIYQAYVIISPPGNPYSYYSYLPNALPVKAGRIKANNVFDAYSQTGTWSIVGYGVCDYAFNCSGSTADADIVALFGTDTFTVTP